MNHSLISSWKLSLFSNVIYCGTFRRECSLFPGSLKQKSHNTQIFSKCLSFLRKQPEKGNQVRSRHSLKQRRFFEKIKWIQYLVQWQSKRNMRIMCTSIKKLSWRVDKKCITYKKVS